MRKIAIIGGDNQRGYENKLKSKNLQVKFHDGRMKRTGGKNFFTSLLKDVECVIIILSAVSHGTMYTVKDIAKELGIKIVYQQNKGITGVINVIHDHVAFY